MASHLVKRSLLAQYKTRSIGLLASKAIARHPRTVLSHHVTLVSRQQIRFLSSSEVDEEQQTEEVEEDPEVVAAREKAEAKAAREALEKKLAEEKLAVKTYNEEVRNLRREFQKEQTPKEKKTATEWESLDKSVRRKVEKMTKRLPHLARSQLAVLATPPLMKIKYSKAQPKAKSSKADKDRSNETDIEFKSSMSDLTTLTPSEEWVIDDVELETMISKSLESVVPVTEGFKESLPQKLAPLSPLFLQATDYRYANDPQSIFESYTLIIKDEEDDTIEDELSEEQQVSQSTSA